MEFLAARNSAAIDIIVLTITATFLPPVLLSLIEFIASMIGAKIYHSTHRIVIWLLVALLLLPPFKPLYQIAGMWWLVAASAFAGAISETYLRLRPKGVALAILSPIVLILPGLFLFHSSVHKIVRPTGRLLREYPRLNATAPIVMIVFDEFPLTSLMDDHDQINSRRYPNIARLAQSATWYRNASSVADGTLASVPAILDGLLPEPDKQLLPSAKDHPHSLFTLLGGSYQMNVVENNTRLCPEDLCSAVTIGSSRYQNLYSLFSDLSILYLYLLLPSELTYSLPNITLSWKQFTVAQAQIRAPAQKDKDFDLMTVWEDRPGVFARFVDSIRGHPKPTLHFLHITLPHAPWEYLPSGKKYTPPENSIRGLIGVNDRGVDAQQWLNDSWAIQQAYQRHLLQVGLADRLIGNLIDHLKDVKLFAPSLIVITADHGTSFRPHASRRIPSSSNYADIMAIPLFIKAPYQEKGEISDANVETIDILPTMADILGIKLPWPTDGRSALNPSEPAKSRKISVLEDGRKFERDAWTSDKYETIKQKLAWFGYGPEDLFHIGPYKELIGQDIQDLHVTRSPVKCNLDLRTYFENVDLDSQFVLTNVCGQLSRGQQPFASPLNIAVVINDTIRGMTQSYLDPQGVERFSSVLSDTDFRSGYNHVAVYVVSKVGNQFELAATEDAEIPPYRWGEVLHFGVNGNAQSYKAGGWSEPEDRITWSNGSRADLVLPTSVPQKSIRLRLCAAVYLKPGKVDRQRVQLLVNRQFVADWVLSNPEFEVREITIPPNILNDSKRTAITFAMPDSISPSSIGDGNDIRQLGIAVSWLSLSEE